jgi:hypothetical protein
LRVSWPLRLHDWEPHHPEDSHSPRSYTKGPRLPATMAIPTPLYGALLTAIFAIYSQLHFSGISPTAHPLPWTNPKRPFFLHEALLAQLLTFLALWLPFERKFLSAVFLPPLFAVYWTLLGSGALSPAVGYAVGTFIAAMGMKALELLVFRLVSSMKLASESNSKPTEAIPTSPIRRAGWVFELQHCLRGVGWNWGGVYTRGWEQKEALSKPRWLLRRVIRGAVMYTWIDFLVYWIHEIDTDYFLPSGHATGLTAPPAGVPYASLFAIQQTPNPRHWGKPKDLSKMSALLGLDLSTLLPSSPLFWQTIRTLFSASAMWTAISGLCTVVALIFVFVGCILGSSTGFRNRWLDPRSWPDAFGDWGAGDWKGVCRFWGRGWHGLFRTIFTAPVDGAIRVLGLNPRGSAAKGLRVTVPFAMSALLHVAGAWTQSFGGWGTARFFLLQPIGCILEMIVEKGYRKFLRPRRPGTVYRLVEGVVVYGMTIMWFTATSESFFEDYRWGGLWRVEPIPFSPYRYMRGEYWTVWMTHPDLLGGRGWWRWVTEQEAVELLPGWLGEWAEYAVVVV